MLRDKTDIKAERKRRIRKRIRKKICGTSERPRLYVFRSNRYIYLQTIDDINGKVITAASTLEKEFRDKVKNSKNKEACQVLGEIMAQRLKEKNIARVVLDRGVYPYHGRVKILAEKLRQSGVSF